MQGREIRDRIERLLDDVERAGRESGNGAHVRQTLVDLLEDLKDYEQALRESEGRFRSVLENSLDAAYRRDLLDDTYDYLSPVIETVMGIAPAHMRSMTVGELVERIHPEDVERVRRAMEEGIQSGRGRVEYRFRDDAGQYRWLADHFTVQFDAAGKARFRGGIVRDVTEQKRAEEALRASERLYRAIGESIDYGIWACDAEGRNTYVSDSLLRLVGITREQCANDGWGDALHPDDTADTLAAWRECVRTGGTWYREHRFRGTDGQWHPVLACGVPVRDDQGRITAWAGINLDISRLKQVEAERERLLASERAARDAAEAASEAKDHFLAVLSHELRTPLTPVLAAAESLESDLTLPEAARDTLRMIRRNVELEARLIDDLLDVTRIARGKLELQTAVLDVHVKVAHVAAICRDEATAKGLAIEVEPAATSHHVEGDPARLQQVLWNLLKNAIKFTSAPGRIVVRTSNPKAGRVAIEVTDTGIGFDAEALPRMFTAFEQGGRAVTRQFGGLGLGLAISRALTELHRGTITAQSPGAGRGATFAVELPACAAPEAKRPAAAKAPRELLVCSVLLVEDHEDTRRIMARLLGSLGCQVQTAGTVADALALAEAHRFDLVISDIGLPDATGVDLMRELRSRHGLRGIALSGYGRDDDLARSREAGFEVHLTKPVNFQTLAEIVRRMILNK